MRLPQDFVLRNDERRVAGRVCLHNFCPVCACLCVARRQVWSRTGRRINRRFAISTCHSHISLQRSIQSPIHRHPVTPIHSSLFPRHLRSYVYCQLLCVHQSNLWLNFLYDLDAGGCPDSCCASTYHLKCLFVSAYPSCCLDAYTIADYLF